MIQPNLTAPPRGRSLRRRLGRHSSALRSRRLRSQGNGLVRFLRMVLGLCCCCWCVPVIEHLTRQNEVERETRDKPVEDDFIVHLLQGREDAR